MTFSRLLMLMIAMGAVVGGGDKLLGNRFGLGQKFDEGFLLMGPMALSMTGIICLAPLASTWLGGIIHPVLSAVNIDPAMFGCVLAIDMGGTSWLWIWPRIRKLDVSPALSLLPCLAARWCLPFRWE